MSNWYYATDGERHGPVPTDELRTLATAGRVTASTMVWTDGWPEWKPATSVPELDFREAASATAGQVSYFAPSGLPPRAARVMAGYAAPTGDTGDWPLDDVHVARLTDACLARKRVRQAAGLYRSLCVLTAVAVVFAAIGVAAAGGYRSISHNPAAVPIYLGVTIVLAVLYGLAARATRRNYGWGCRAVIVTLVVSTLVSLYGIVSAISSNSLDAAGVIILNVVSLLFNVAFAVTSIRGLSGIKAFRAAPAWCQEALVLGEATRSHRDDARSA